LEITVKQKLKSMRNNLVTGRRRQEDTVDGLMTQFIGNRRGSSRYKGKKTVTTGDDC
jgi:hypothetical protein